MSAKRRQEAIAQFSVPLGVSGSTPNHPVATGSLDDDDDDIEANYTDNGVTKTRENRGVISKGKGKAASNGENPKVMLLSLKAVRAAVLNRSNCLLWVTLGCCRTQFNG